MSDKKEYSRPTRTRLEPDQGDLSLGEVMALADKVLALTPDRIEHLSLPLLEETLSLLRKHRYVLSDHAGRLLEAEMALVKSWSRRT